MPCLTWFKMFFNKVILTKSQSEYGQYNSEECVQLHLEDDANTMFPFDADSAFICDIFSSLPTIIQRNIVGKTKIKIFGQYEWPLRYRFHMRKCVHMRRGSSPIRFVARSVHTNVGTYLYPDKCNLTAILSHFG